MARPRPDPGVLGPRLLEEFTQRSSRALATREEVLELTGRLLLSSGFDRVRYYEVGRESIPGLSREPVLYLSWRASRSKATAANVHRIGFSIPAMEATFWQQPQADRMRPMPGTAFLYSPQSNHPKWVAELGLEGRSWIDVGVYDHRNLIGLLAFDWDGPSLELNESNTISLSLFGELLGGELAATSPRLESELQEELKKLHERRPQRTGDLITRAATSIQQSLGVSSVSIFRFDWTQELLERQVILSHEGIPPVKPPNNEVFRLGEDYLTARAWNDENCRRVLDFSEMERIRPELVHSASKQFHKDALGNVQSVMYGVVGARDRRFMLRLINNVRHPFLPFLSEYDVFLRFMADLAPVVDAAIASERAASVRRVEKLVAERVSPDLLMDDMTKEFSSEGIALPCVIARRKASKPYFVWGISGRGVPTLRDSLERDEEFGRAVARRGRFIASAPDESSALAHLRMRGDQGEFLGLVSFGAGDTEGVVAFPVRSKAVSPGRDARDYLVQLSSILGQSLEYDLIARQGEGALNALRLVGHEMATPLAAMKQVSARALQVAETAANGGPVDKTELESLKSKLQYQTDTLEAAVRLGHLVGRQADGRLIGMFAGRSLREMINSSIFRVRRELAHGDLLAPRGGIQMLRPSGVADARIACDRPLVESALANIYRNAIKYSVEQKEIARVSTNVRVSEGPNGSCVDIAITNVGIGIPAFHEELIFDAFARFASDVDDIARRGMGLGLYLGRQIARAHGGDVVLTEHDRLSRSGRYTDQPAFRTTFTLRLRTDLPEGPYVHEVKSGNR